MSAPFKILVVDDDPAFCELVSRSLVSDGCSVEVADTGAAAEAKFVPPFDLVLLDLKLPDRDGLEVLRKIRSYSHSLPVLILSGYYKDPERPEDPFTFFSEKLSSLESLCQVIQQHIARVKQQQQL
jgi:CheY-like chemotaxis protein